MSDQELFLLIFGVLCAAAGVVARRAYEAIAYIVDYRKKLKTHPGLIAATADNVCKVNHKWDKVRLALAGLPVDTYTVCTECGYVVAMTEDDEDFKLNEPALELYRETLKQQKEEDVKYMNRLKRRQDKLQEIMNSQIRAHVGQLTDDLQKNIEVMQQFFRKSTIEVESLLVSLKKETETK